MKRRNFFERLLGVIGGVAAYKSLPVNKKYPVGLTIRDVVTTASSGYVSVTPVSGSGTITNSITPSFSFREGQMISFNSDTKTMVCSHEQMTGSTVACFVGYRSDGSIYYYDINGEEFNTSHT